MLLSCFPPGRGGLCLCVGRERQASSDDRGGGGGAEEHRDEEEEEEERAVKCMMAACHHHHHHRSSSPVKQSRAFASLSLYLSLSPLQSTAAPHPKLLHPPASSAIVVQASTLRKRRGRGRGGGGACTTLPLSLPPPPSHLSPTPLLTPTHSLESKQPATAAAALTHTPARPSFSIVHHVGPPWCGGPGRQAHHASLPPSHVQIASPPPMLHRLKPLPPCLPLPRRDGTAWVSEWGRAAGSSPCLATNHGSGRQHHRHPSSPPPRLRKVVTTTTTAGATSRTARSSPPPPPPLGKPWCGWVGGRLRPSGGRRCPSRPTRRSCAPCRPPDDGWS